MADCARIHSDQPALDLIGAILGDGRSSRLYRSLVYDARSAREVRVYHHSQEIAGEFMVQLTANPDTLSKIWSGRCCAN